jgi:hypothetical protein
VFGLDNGLVRENGVVSIKKPAWAYIVGSHRYWIIWAKEVTVLALLDLHVHLGATAHTSAWTFVCASNRFHWLALILFHQKDATTLESCVGTHPYTNGHTFWVY